MLKVKHWLTECHVTLLACLLNLIDGIGVVKIKHDAALFHLAAVLHMRMVIADYKVILTELLPDNVLAVVIGWHWAKQLVAHHRLLKFFLIQVWNVIRIDGDDTIGIDKLQRWKHVLNKHLQAAELLNLVVYISLKSLLTKSLIQLGRVSDAPVLISECSAYR